MESRHAALTLGLLLLASSAHAQTPLIPYSGRLEQSGQAAQGAHDFRFALFADPAGAADCLVTATQPADSCGLWWTQVDAVPVNAGAFGVLLGQTTPLTGAVLAQSQLYLAIAVKPLATADYTLLSGKQRIAEVPRAAAARDFHVEGSLTVKDVATLGPDGSGGPRTLAFAREGGDQGDAGKIAYRPGWDSAALGIVGAGTTSGDRKVRVWDDLEINDTLSAPTALLGGKRFEGIDTIEVTTTEINIDSGTVNIASSNTHSPSGWNVANSICFLSRYRWSHDHAEGAGYDSTGVCHIDDGSTTPASSVLDTAWPGSPARWRLYMYVSNSHDNSDGDIQCFMRCIRWDR